MTDLHQGDIIKISGFRSILFLIVSKNAFIRAAGVFHVCPLMKDCPPGPVHIFVHGTNGGHGTAICEQLKLIDPSERSCTRTGRIPYEEIMEVSDTVQGLFEYD
jgi:mRNA-degrading endonuclease toxin of MazEF toxin-antitoxin module